MLHIWQPWWKNMVIFGSITRQYFQKCKLAWVLKLFLEVIIRATNKCGPNNSEVEFWIIPATIWPQSVLQNKCGLNNAQGGRGSVIIRVANLIIPPTHSVFLVAILIHSLRRFSLEKRVNAVVVVDLCWYIIQSTLSILCFSFNLISI